MISAVGAAAEADEADEAAEAMAALAGEEQGFASSLDREGAGGAIRAGFSIYEGSGCGVLHRWTDFSLLVSFLFSFS